jgi:hypothetical protein
MPKMVVTHAGVDIGRWLQGKAERVAGFTKWATKVTEYVAADGSNNVNRIGGKTDEVMIPHRQPRDRQELQLNSSREGSL